MTRTDRLLAVAAIAVGALVAWPWLASAPAPVAEASERVSPSPPLAPLPPLATFAAVFERPLFSPTRRPPPDGKAPAVSSTDAARYRLLGLMTVGNARRALIAEGA